MLDSRGHLVPDDWVPVANDVPATGAVIVSLERLRTDVTLTERAEKLGVLLPGGTDADALAPFLQRLALVALAFPVFRDGRAFTAARTLRERYGFAGDIRATGHILPDQFVALLRCGVSSVALPETADLSVWEAATHHEGQGNRLPFLRRRALPFATA